MNKYIKELIVPAILIFIAICFMVSYIIFLFMGKAPITILLIHGGIILGVISTIIYTFVVRIKEIKEIDEDDYSNY